MSGSKILKNPRKNVPSLDFSVDMVYNISRG